MTSPGGDRQVKIVVAADVAEAIRGLTQVSEAAGNVGGASQDAEKQSSSWLDALKTGLGVVGVQTGLDGVVSGFKAVVDMGMTYEDSLNSLRAVTGANDDQMRQLGDTAKALGNDVMIPGASASDAAAAMLELAKGGLTATEAMDASRGTMILAAAAQIQGAEAAEIQANALNTFGLKADQAGRVANVLANVANQSSGEITDFSQGLAQAGTVASSFGWSIEETTTMLGLMANAGIKGSDAGTSLKTTMTAMLKPTEQQAGALADLGIKTRDASGHMISAKDLTEQLAAAKMRMTDADFNAAAATAFGTDAVRTALVAAQQGAAGYEQMNTALLNTTGAADVAAANTSGLSGSLDKFNNSVGAVGLTLYETLAPALKEIVEFGSAAFDWLGDAIKWISDLPGPVLAGAAALGAMIVLKGPLNALFLQAIAGYTRMAVAVRAASFSFAGVATAAKGALAAIGGPFGLAIIGVTTALTFFAGSTDDAAGAQDDFAGALDETTGKLNDQAAATISAKVSSSGLGEQYQAMGGNVADLVDAIGGIPEKQAIVNKVLEDAAAAAQAAGGAYTNAGAAAAAGGGEVVLTADEMAASTDHLSGELAKVQGTGDLYNQLLVAMSGAQSEAQITAAGLGGELGATESVAVDTAAAMKEYSDKLKTATENARILAENTPLAQYLSDVKVAADDANRSMDYFRALQDELTGKTRSYNDAVAAQAGALASVAAAFKEGTAAATENTEAGDLNTDALAEWDVAALTATADGRTMYDQLTRLADGHLGTANAAFQHAVTEGKTLPEAMAAGRAEADANREAFIELATQYNGGNREAAEMLADKLGILAGAKIEDKNFQVIADDQQAQDALRAAQTAEIADKTFRITALAGVDQASMDAANAKAAAFGYGPTDYNAILEGKADGGWVSGPGGPRDDMVKARLSPGEFVVNAAQAGKHAGLLEAINNGRMGFADGGVVPGGDTTATAGAAVAVSAPDPAVFQAAWKAIAEAVRAAWDSVILPIMEAMSLRNLQAGEEFTTLAETVQTQQQSVIQPTYDALNAGSEDVGIWQMWLRDVWAQAWQANQDKTTSVWALLQGTTFPEMVAGLNNLGATQQQLAATTDQSWSQIGSRIQGTYEGSIVPAWEGVQSFAAEVGAFFAGIAAGTDAAAAQAVSDIGEITAAIDEFFKMVDGKVAASPTPPTTVTVGSPGTPMADGGLITMGTGPRTDDVHIRASKGEYVVNAAATARHKDTLDAINYGGAFADGGLIGEKITSGVENAMVLGMQRAVEAGVNKVLTVMPSAGSGGYTSNGQWGPANPGGLAANTAAARDFIIGKWGITNIGGFGGGSVSGSDHPLGKALDVMIANYKSESGIAQGTSVADWFIGNPNAFGTKYVIWRDRINQGGTWAPYSHPSGNNDTLAHRDHVHLSFLTGDGVFQGQVTAPEGDDDPEKAGWLGAMLKKIKAGGSAGAIGGGVAGSSGVWGTTAKMNTNTPDQWADDGTMEMVGPVPPGGAEERWRPMYADALRAKGMYSEGALSNMMYQMHTESGGNPLAINKWDRNWAAGYPSKSLLQVIGPTFRDNGDPGYNTNIWDPWSNALAALNYVNKNYGGVFPGTAYDTGGDLHPGWTLAYNGTGTTEHVSTGPQWNAIQQGAHGGPLQIQVSFAGDGAITAEMARTATVTVDGRFVEYTRELQTARAQTT